MPAASWNEIERLFLEAADLPLGERAAFLDHACNGNAELRSEVDSLLRADTAGTSSITTAVESEAGLLLNDDPSSFAGTRLGPYLLLEQIGRGGMGSVYLAERDDEHYRKRVAIKVVRSGMDSEEVLARFRHERQILAALEHPYIGRLLDGGTTPDGRPFFVMEYVPGEPIDAYCRRQNLSLEDRLRLFLRVCEAVSHAHRSLVVHRDLKPGNILVASDGVPKLLDFGVAKLLVTDDAPGLTTTSFAMLPLTPEYACPEQVRGLPITTASDVYALGAILFELLTGIRAQKVEVASASEIDRVVCQTDTPRPSSVAPVAGAPRKIDTDIDNIVLMAMRKEPERRYQSVTRLADDIERYLNGQPVLARKGSFAYHAQKFARRHRVAVTATLLILLSLVGGIAGAISQARRAESARRIAEVQRGIAEKERQRAEAQRQEAERQRAIAEAQTQVATTEKDRSQRRLEEMLGLADRSLFDVHSAIETLPGATEARRKIVDTTLRYLKDLSADAAQDDRLRFAVGVSYWRVANVLGFPLQPNLGDSKGALENYEKSATWLEPLVKNHPDRPEFIGQWIDTTSDWATLLAHMGDQRRAVEMLQEALPTARRLAHLCPDKPKCLLYEPDVYGKLLDTVYNRDSAAALQYSEMQTHSLEHIRRKSPENRDVQLNLATAYSQQAKVYNVRAQLREATDRFRQAIALRETAMISNPSDVFTRRNLMISYGNLGGTLGSPFYPNLGDTVGARECYGKALAIARDLARADANDQLAQYDLANALLFYSSLELPKEEWPTSLTNLQQADAIVQKLVAADPRSNSKLRTLAMIQESEGKRFEGLENSADALAQYRLSLATAEKALTRDSSDLSMTSQALAAEEAISQSLAHQGDRPAALDLAQQAIARAGRISIGESDRDRKDRAVAMAYQNLSEIQAGFENWKEARQAAVQAVAAWGRMRQSGSRRIDPAKAARAEALLVDCDAHLK